ncbi:protein translocase subunit SecD [Kineothrix sp. MB12-C1]|uniref:protein translocase subunit SecD n=1 Tax=Kineothrix sp. MB12-C1 TaxID=3070215 RepID=UPI0027D293A8|nr:protein translocase subunit SecD [Kineothrix sp. MB12-C1]WMC92209.1 protein translocase subunit SecD [Kineothrix sp. MB12-C1]
MKKNRAIIVLLVMVLALGGLVFTATVGIGTEKAGSASGIKLGLDLAGGVSITYQAVGEEDPTDEDMADTIYKLQKRVENYSTEAQVYKEGSNRINIEIPGVSDENEVLQELGKPGSLVFMNSSNEEVLTGTDVANAQAGTQQDSMGNSQFVVQLTMTDEGRVKFAEATRAAYPTNDIIYIIYDNAVISAPAVQAEITDGQAVITGMASYEEAEALASTIRIGGLKLQLEELRSNVVGAQLGSEAISTSLKAGAAGFVLVVIFMLVTYYVMGAAASLALAIYTALIIVLLNAFEITLTLPGIAGIILSIGMAVDANVIIFARVREELATGKTIPSAVKIGFEKAMSAIIDSNITTLIAALVLGLKGSGTVKGFAQTLALGIILSMFTALFVTRMIMKAFYAVGLKNMKLYGIGKERKTIDFLAKRKIFFAVSLVLIIAGFIVMGINANTKGSILNYSLEFVGGTSTKVVFNEDLSIADIDSKVVPEIEAITGSGDVQTQKVAGTNEVIFKTRTLTVSEREEMKEALVESFTVDEEKITSETISSAISKEMQSDAAIAVIIAVVCMLIYIWFRFKDIRFGTSSVIALINDVAIVFVFYGISRISVGGTFIACMLTIVGYSINSTIVIFDRIREKVAAAAKNVDLKELVNESITQTLSRSIFTSLTTFLMVLALYIFGVTSIREFALPLMVGIICGTYSSICLSGALWYVFRTKIVKKN